MISSIVLPARFVSLSARALKSSALVAAALCLLAPPPACASIQVLGYYRMEETSGPQLLDSSGGKTLSAEVFTHLAYGAPEALRMVASKGCGGFTATTNATGARLTFATDNFGMECWVRLDSVGDAEQAIAYNGRYGDGSSDGWGLELLRGCFAMRVGNGFALSAPVNAGQWYHVAMVRDRGASTLYVDGKPISGNNATPTAPSDIFSLGQRYYEPSIPAFTGKLDEVRVFTFEPGKFVVTDLLRTAPDIIPRKRLLFLYADAGENEEPGTVTLGFANGGGSPLEVSDITLSPGAAEAGFSFDAELPFTVKPNAARLIPVSFKPRKAGLVTATLTIHSNDPNEPNLEIALSANGKAVTGLTFLDAKGVAHHDEGPAVPFPTLATPSSRVSQTFTVRNSGSTTLEALHASLAGTNAEDFSLLSGGPVKLEPGESTTFTVYFSSSAGGVRRADLLFRLSEWNLPAFKVRLAGIGSGREIAVSLPSGEELQTGEVVAWGRDYQPGSVLLPEALDGVAKIVAHRSSGLALKNDGTVVGWSFEYPFGLTVPAGLTGVTSVAQGDYHALALRKDGSVAGWGDSSFGQASVPPGLVQVRAVTATSYGSVALKEDGTLALWGQDSGLGLDTGIGRSVAISGGDRQVLVRTENGRLAGWGWGGHDAAGGIYAGSPAALTGVKAVAAGTLFNRVLLGDGSATGWQNPSDAVPQPQVAPVFPGISGLVAIAAGYDHTLALKSDGTVLADGPAGDPAATVPDGLNGVTAIAAGEGASFAIRNSVVDFGGLVSGSAGVVKTFKVKNTGLMPLTLSDMTLTPGGGFSFPAGQPLLTGVVIPARGSKTLSVMFTPGTTPGEKRSMLRIYSDDGDEPSFDIELHGATAESPLAAWRRTHFGTLESTGDAADLADPNGNGLSNLLEYALGGDPVALAKPGDEPRIRFSLDPTTRLPQIHFTRDALHPGVLLVVESADSPSDPNNYWDEIAGSSADGRIVGAGLRGTVVEGGTGEFRQVTVTDRRTFVHASKVASFLRLKAISQ